MSKFIIENILIEKSDKDITTGQKYSLIEGFNLICGNNEAGKSSLMNFIRNCFFKTKGIDTGKIYFKLFDKNYRADIKDARSTDDRCKLFDEQGNSCNYNIIEENVKQKYFEEGFTINLDDLMAIQNKTTEEFINTIKDPSGDKLNHLLEEIKEDISNNLGANAKLKKAPKELLDKIENLSEKIKLLSKKEANYNLNNALIKTLQKEIQEIIKKEEALKLFKESKNLSIELKEFIKEKEEISTNFNLKLFEDKERYFDLIQTLGRYPKNQELIVNSSEKIETLRKKILDEKTRLNLDYGLSLDEKIISSITVDYDKIKKIKDLIEQLEEINSVIKLEKQKIETLNDSLIEVKYEIENLLQNKENNKDFEILDNTIKELNDGLDLYHFLTNEINNATKESIINANSVNNNNKLKVILIFLFVLSVICSVISFYQKIQTAGIFSILMSILTLFGFASLKISSYEDKIDEEKIKKDEQRKQILNNLKSIVKPYYKEIDNIEFSYLPSKLDNIKQNLVIEFKDLKSNNDLFLHKISERNITDEKINNSKSKISKLNEEIEKLTEEIKNLSDKNITNENIIGKKYLDIIEIIKSLKENLENEKNLSKELEETKQDNEEILSKVKNFIIENNINITISDDAKDITMRLNQYYDRNSIVKQEIDNLSTQISSIEKKLSELGDVQEIFESEDDLKLEREEKIKQKNEAGYKQRDLEKVEGISELKTEKNILIEEYRKLIKNLFINKMSIELTNTAKSEFDKTQPDLINAQKYLAILTDNKYSKINLELQEIENENGSKIKKWEHLSRGTKEQLYLALKLGYASNYAKDKSTLEDNGRANLPLIVDDAFVNFDLIRTKNALKCLIEFAKTNQVLFFTCHSEVISSMLKELNEEKTNIIQL